MLRSVYDQLATPVNLVRWRVATEDRCAECSSKGTLKHILSACVKSLGWYTWRHNQVLEKFEKICVSMLSSESRSKNVRIRTEK